MIQWPPLPIADPALLRPLNELEVGDFFRCDIGAPHCWVYGTLLMANRSRCLVRVAGFERQVVSFDTQTGAVRYQQSLPESQSNESWPLEVPVELVTEQTLHRQPETAHGRQDMADAGNASKEAVEVAMATGLQAKYDFQLKQLVKAEEVQDMAKVEVAKSRLTALQSEAELKGVRLRLALAPARSIAQIADATAPAESATSKKVASPKPQAAKKVAAPQTKSATPAKLKSTHNCICGCGRECNGLYAPGHDASVKSLLLKVERGQLATTVINDILGAFVAFKGKHGTDTYRLTKAPVKIPGRPEVENTSLMALEALDV